MATRFSILGSGSSGNSALLATDSTRVLIDAGFSARKLGELLARLGESLEGVQAVFLTHEHGDHAAGIEGLKRFPHIKVFANEATARTVQAGLGYRPDWQIFSTGSRFRFRDLEIEAFAVPHDAHDPVGFRISTGCEGDLFSPPRALAWLTDLGHVPQHVREHVRECDVLVVEANHCPRLLQADTRRPWSTKQRIAGRHGHLSNEGVRDLLADVASPRWRHIYLTHLSRDCNSPAAIDAALAPIRSSLHCDFTVVTQGISTPFIEL